MHNGIAFGVVAVYIDILFFNKWDRFDALLGRVECIGDNLLNHSYLVVIYPCCKVYLEVFEFIEKFANVHIDYLKCTEFTQQIA